jgi:hypothetical protein
MPTPRSSTHSDDDDFMGHFDRDSDEDDLDEYDLDDRESGDDATGGSEMEMQLDTLSEALRPILHNLPAVLAAKQRMDLPSNEAPDIGDIDRLLVYATETWQLVEVLLEEIPRPDWPHEAVALQDLVTGVNATLQRPLEIDFE